MFVGFILVFPDKNNKIVEKSNLFPPFKDLIHKQKIYLGYLKVQFNGYKMYLFFFFENYLLLFWKIFFTIEPVQLISNLFNRYKIWQMRFIKIESL